MPQVIKNFIEKHERHIGTAALFVGAAFDWLTITKPDSLFGGISLATYLAVAGGSILLLNARSAREKESVWLVVLLQFCFGNLASGLLVLYSQSATLVGSWLFLLVLGAFLVGNEFARKRYVRLRSQLVGYFILVTAYAGFVVPVLLTAVGTSIFLLSVALSLSFMVGYVALIYAAAPSRVRGDWKGTLVGVVIVAGVFNALYFLNFIPPVPLSLKEAGVYHSVTRSVSGYAVVGEIRPKWYDIRALMTTKVHIVAEEGLYCFSSVYAPVGLKTPIYHRWEQYDMTSKEWETRARIPFPISGGRDEGYRGYSYKGSLADGEWRCSIETQEGALIGRRTFTVSVIAQEPELVTEIR